jgi:predicted nucleotidyltransferase
MDSMPAASLAILADRFHRGKCIPSQEFFAPAIFAQLRSLSLEKMADIPGMNEGLAERLKEYAGKTRDLSFALSSLITDVSTKRHPQTRVRRCLLHMLLGLETADFDLFDNKKGPLYLRILGFDKKGQYLLKKMKTTAVLPILMKGSDFLEYANNPGNRAIRRMAELDSIATDLWMFQTGVGPGRDYTAPPVTLPRKSGDTNAL